jgi:hypothetical protein
MSQQKHEESASVMEKVKETYERSEKDKESIQELEEQQILQERSGQELHMGNASHQSSAMSGRRKAVLNSYRLKCTHEYTKVDHLRHSELSHKKAKRMW